MTTSWIGCHATSRSAGIVTLFQSRMTVPLKSEGSVGRRTSIRVLKAASVSAAVVYVRAVPSMKNSSSTQPFFNGTIVVP